MATHSEVNRFLQEVFGGDHAQKAIFANLHPPFHTRDHTKLNIASDCYWSIAAFRAQAGSNVLIDATEVRALVIDDVGTKVPPGAVALALGEATAEVETSAGNFQWVYRLSVPVEPGVWGAFFAEIERMVGAKLEGRSAVHLMRLPTGVNTKQGRGAFRVRLEALRRGVKLDPHKISYGGVSTRAAGAGALGPEPRVRDIGRLLSLIPNDISTTYDDWIGRAHQVKALALDEEDAFEAFDAWSRQRSDKYDEAETRRRWDTVRVERTRGLVLLADAEAADPKGFEAFQGAEASGVFDDGAEAPPAPPVAAAAKHEGVEFARGENDTILKNMENVVRGLDGLGIVCRRDTFHHRVYVGAERLSDDLIVELRVLLIKAYEKDFGLVHIYDAVVAMASQNKFNPVTEMLAGAELLWDGVARLDRLGPDYFHTDDTPLARECFRKVMIAAVRRARRPGVKFDQILVTESPEGWNKSTAWAVLAGEGNFSDASILGKEAREVQEALADIWIHENSDLSGLSRAEVEHVKAFASRTTDRARPAYGRVLVDQPRQSIEVGTTNSDSYLLSQTGNRRFWPFKLAARVDLDALRRDRLALWGEAAAAEGGGESLVLDERLWGEAAAEVEKRRVIDPWEDELANLTGHMAVKRRQGKDFITRVGVHEFLRLRGQATNAGSGRRIADVMRKLGWTDCRYKISGEAVRGFERDPVDPFEEDGDTLEGDGVTHVSPENPF